MIPGYAANPGGPMSIHWLQSALTLAQQDDGMGWISMLTLWVPILVLFYFLLIRPQRNDAKRRQEMLSGVKKNDRVVTVGGIYGVVANVHREADEITLKIDENNNTRIRVTVGSVARVVRDETAADKTEDS
jgi:preprotein translocase subunit YajC